MKNRKSRAENGRSMIEMLGVLAIVGVLSVGAIAGYQKAMRKYRLNKFISGYDQLLGNAITLSEHVEPLKAEGRLLLTSTLNELNLIPEGFTYKKNMDRIYDMFGNDILLLTRYGYNYTWDLSISLGNSDYSQDQCVQIIRIAQVYREQLISLLREDYNTSDYKSKSLYGEKPFPAGAPGKKPSSPMLSSLSLSQIQSLCQDTTSFGNKSYPLHLLW
jgi:hypothetical protein